MKSRAGYDSGVSSTTNRETQELNEINLPCIILPREDRLRPVPGGGTGGGGEDGARRDARDSGRGDVRN